MKEIAQEPRIGLLERTGMLKILTMLLDRYC